MAIQIFPQQISLSDQLIDGSFSVNLTEANKKYFFENNFVLNGIYNITCPSSIEVSFQPVVSSSTKTYSSVADIIKTLSGSAQTTIDQSYDSAFISCDSGSNVAVAFELVGIASSESVSSTQTIESITNTQTYNQTGKALIMIIGAGSGGASGITPQSWGAGGPGGRGGNSGTAKVLYQQINSPVPITIGSGGSFPAGAGGSTTFGNITADGGSSNIYGSAGAIYPRIAPGTIPYIDTGHGYLTEAGQDGSGYGASGFTISDFHMITTGQRGDSARRGNNPNNWGMGGGIYAGGGAGFPAYQPTQYGPGLGTSGHGGGGGGGVIGNPGDSSVPGFGTGGPGAVYIIRHV